MYFMGSFREYVWKTKKAATILWDLYKRIAQILLNFPIDLNKKDVLH